MGFCSVTLLDIHLANAHVRALCSSIEQIQQTLIMHLLCARCLFPLNEKSFLSKLWLKFQHFSGDVPDISIFQ